MAAAEATAAAVAATDKAKACERATVAQLKAANTEVCLYRSIGALPCLCVAVFAKVLPWNHLRMPPLVQTIDCLPPSPFWVINRLLAQQVAGLEQRAAAAKAKAAQVRL